MKALASIIWMLVKPDIYVTAEPRIDPCDNITTIEMAIGCSTVNGKRVNVFYR